MNLESKQDYVLIDTHVHLNEIASPEQAVREARNRGVIQMVAVGMGIDSNRLTLEFARRFKGCVHAAIGYHPWEIREEEIEETLHFLARHLDECVAVGEVGLDYRAKIKKPLQREVFSRVLKLALERDLPVIVHSRYSHERTYKMVCDAGLRRAVFHWYSGPVEMVEKIAAAGYMISATPALAYSHAHRAAILCAPLENILIETDAPVEYQGKISRPADVVDTLRALSELKRIPAAELAMLTTANAKRFFMLT